MGTRDHQGITRGPQRAQVPQGDLGPQTGQNTNVFYMFVQCSHTFALKHITKVLNEHLLDVGEDSSECEKNICVWLGIKQQLSSMNN